ncbi:MAG: outer membrane beta-barrel protein [Bacteroidales bacterium]|jgi:hypothetical protein|nr:outer membrane beta-barrel protein [Bacteroidales bacterium]
MVAQNNIFGVVYDTILKKPVEYCTVIMLNSKDSTFQAGTITDNKGIFNFTIKQKGTKILQISYAGKTISYINIDIQQNMKIDTIFIIPNILDEIVIAESPYTRDIDKLSVNTANLKLPENATAVDVLKALPGAYLNKNDKNFQIIGKSVRILVDDKPLYMPYETLQQLFENQPSENIEKVEINFTPPPKYVDEWDGVVINLIKKKNINFTITGSVGDWIVYRKKINNEINANLSVETNKISFNIAIGYSYLNRLSNSILTQTDINSAKITNREVDTSTNSGHDIYLLTDFSYKINDKNTIGLNYNFSFGKNKYKNSYEINNYINEISDSTLQQFIDNNINNINNSVGIFYKYNFDSRNHFITFSSNAGYTKNIDTYINKFAYYSKEILYPEKFSKNNMYRPNNLFEISVNADHNLKINKFTISDGVSFIRNENITEYTVENQENNDLLIVPNQINKFIFTEQFVRTYFAFGHQVTENFSYRIGARVFYFFNKENSQTINFYHNNNYFSIVPTVYLNYTTPKLNSFDLTYDMTLYSPTATVLNPAKIYTTPNYFFVGNPYLKHGFYHRLSFGFINLDTEISATLSYNLNDKIYAQRPVLDSSKTKIIGYQYDNFLVNHNINLIIPYSFSFIDERLEINLKANASYQYSKAIDNSFKTQNWNYGGSVNISYTLKKIDFEFWAAETYNSIYLSGYQKYNPYFSTACGINYDINSSWSIGFQIDDIFNQSNRGNLYEYQGIEYKNDVNPDRRFFRLMLDYNFGNSKK